MLAERSCRNPKLCSESFCGALTWPVIIPLFERFLEYRPLPVGKMVVEHLLNARISKTWSDFVLFSFRE